MNSNKHYIRLIKPAHNQKFNKQYIYAESKILQGLEEEEEEVGRADPVGSPLAAEKRVCACGRRVIDCDPICSCTRHAGSGKATHKLLQDLA
jgi:hypothetical protein